MVLPDSYEYYQYETIQGDTWDMISLDFYHTEYRTDVLHQANPDYIDTLIFEAGIVLIIPVIERVASDTLPPWKR